MSTGRLMTRWCTLSPRSIRTTRSGFAQKPRLSTRSPPAIAAWALLAGLVAAATGLAQTSPAPASAPQAPAAPRAAQGAQVPTPAKRTAKTSRYRPDRFAGRAGTYYKVVWGVDSLGVKWAEAGGVISFSYRVLHADKAKVLDDKTNEPSLVDPQAGVKLVVPSMENVGQLRQSAPPED